MAVSTGFASLQVAKTCTPRHVGAAPRSFASGKLASAPLALGKSVLGHEDRGLCRCNHLFPSHRRVLCHTSSESSSVTTSPLTDTKSNNEGEPMPIVTICQDSDPHATVVEISFGDRLGALLDTTRALKDLGLNVVRGIVTTEEPNKRRKKFLVTRMDNDKKVENPELLEAIRLTIINNLLQYHPESSEQLAMGEAFGIKPPNKKLDVDVATHISITKDGPQSLLHIETADRPGLLMEIIKVIADISVYVESAEIDTEGLVAKDTFHVTYHGTSLSKSMELVLTNSLRYYLRRPETEEDSY